MSGPLDQPYARAYHPRRSERAFENGGIVVETVQRFKYGGPDGEGGRDAPGRKSFLLALTNNVISTVQIFPKGVHNNLHVHLTEDGYWLVLAGQARFYGEGDTIIAEPRKYEGVLIPAGTKYWFEGISDE